MNVGGVPRRSMMDEELRALLEVVAAHGPATRDELQTILEQRSSSLSERALAEAIRRGLVRTFEGTAATVVSDAETTWLGAEEAYVLTRDGAIALGLDEDRDAPDPSGQ